ncbi:MAG: PorV/PorQ family protein [candidate division Zixibacteria bacterium]|nr:PorV/PorQ family protein [candidate division Zixibacteria bacterium]
MKSYSSKILSLLITIGIICSSISAGEIDSKAGTSGFPFLKINIGARSVAMGGAFTGLADDESALYYNPAGIVSLEKNRYIAGYHNYFVDMQSGFLGYIRKYRENLSIGWWASYLNYGDFIRTDQTGTVLGDFSGGDLLLAVSAASRRGYNFSYGGTVKFIFESVEEYTATGLAIDAGIHYSRLRNRLRFGLTVKNLGLQLSSLGDEKDPLPLTLRTGIALRPRGLPFTLSGDIIFPADNDIVFAFGGEYWEFQPFFFRMGWNSFGSNYRTSDSEDSWAGLGIGIGFDIKQMQISYAFTPGAELGNSHRITITGGL